MADIGSIVPDTARVPVAEDLVRREQTQNGSVPEHQHPDSNRGQVGPADQQAVHSNSLFEQPSNAGGFGDAKASSQKGPRSGIHWGAGLHSALCFPVCTM